MNMTENVEIVRDMRDQLPIRGRFLIKRVWQDGRVDYPVDDNNLVVINARNKMRRLIAVGGTSFRVDAMAFGDGGHDPANPTMSIPPSVNDVDLTGVEILEKGVAFEFPDPDPVGVKVTFTATIERSEGNGPGGSGRAISESVLRLQAHSPSDPQIFARKTFGLITKSNQFSLAFKWTIVF